VIDVASLVAIDVHTHVHASARSAGGSGEQVEAMKGYFGSDEDVASNVPGMAAYYRARKMAAVAFTVDVNGRPSAVSNDEIAELAAEHADVIIPFASIDPARGADGVREARRLLDTYGVKGFKFHPNVQAFHPNDPLAYPLYEVIAEHDVPALFHTGHTGVGANVRGGGGIRLKYSNPMEVDDVAVDFPDLTIILAHPSFPWQDEAISVALHKPNVYIDLSGWSPKYFPANLIQYGNTLLKAKLLFGSDYPMITPDRWLADFEQAGFRDDVRPLILKENAVRLLKLG
jgi:predicted TIM-barrel fold metal-dependent hydrolase